MINEVSSFLTHGELMKPGIYRDIPNADYHAGPGVSKSMLDVLAQRSPLHLHHLRTAANDNERTPTPAQMIGTAFHSLLLEPGAFDEQYVQPFVMPEGALVTIDDLKAELKDAGEKVGGTKPELIERLKAARPHVVIGDELKQQYAVTNAGRTILQPEQWEQLIRMRDAVMAHPAARALLSVKGWSELSAYWTDPVTGELCRCRPDYWRHDGVIIDVKTTEDASEEAFARSIASWRYHVQNPFYIDGCAEALRQSDNYSAFDGNPPPVSTAFVFLAVEKTACVVNGKSMGVAVYVLDADSVALGRALYRANLDTYAQCVASGEWPGYGDRIKPIRLPAWEFSRNVAA